MTQTTGMHMTVSRLIKPKYTLAIISSTMILTLTACQGTAGLSSLSYQNSQLLEPLQLPAEQASQPFVPLYPTLDLGDSTINLKNATGDKYQLPAPRRLTNQ